MVMVYAGGHISGGHYDLSEQQRAETAATVHRILRKILHRPTVRAKEFTTGPDGAGLPRRAAQAVRPGRR